jgi:dihydrolipoamide dehydrogenase
VDRGGKHVAIVERDLVGGECSFYACMPSKALLRPASMLHEVARVPGAAQAITGPLDVPAVLSRRDEVVHSLSDTEQLPWLADRGIELIRGHGQLHGERRVLVGNERLVARDAVILATGTTALFPDIPGLADAHAWSNRQITTAHSVPDRLLVLGGGPVGVEMAQAWASLGSRVTLVESLDRLIAHEEPIASEELQAALQRAGIEIRTGTPATQVSRSGHEITVHLKDGSALVADRMLVAIGRRALTADLGLESVEVEEDGYVSVDEHLRVNGLTWLYAVGDVNGRSLLTHAGKYQARIAADHILGDESAACSDGAGSPRVIFTEPQVAAVGLTLSAALEAGAAATVIDVPLADTAGASFYGRGAGGTARFVVDSKRQLLLGATFIGVEVADFLHAATIAIVAQVPLSKVAHAIAPFPTRSEIWLSFLEAFERQQGITLHAPSASETA